jgi:hypothetical protein
MWAAQKSPSFGRKIEFPVFGALNSTGSLEKTREISQRFAPQKAKLMCKIMGNVEWGVGNAAFEIAKSAT